MPDWKMALAVAGVAVIVIGAPIALAALGYWLAGKDTDRRL
jgi:hypothetical protein